MGAITCLHSVQIIEIPASLIGISPHFSVVLKIKNRPRGRFGLYEPERDFYNLIQR